MTHSFTGIVSALAVAGMLAVGGCQSDHDQPQAERAPAGQRDSAQSHVRGQQQSPVQSHARAEAQIRPAQKAPADEKVQGTVTFQQEGDVLVVNADLRGLKPNSTHGIHIHESGDLSAADLSSAGGHFNPTHKHHGAPEDANSHAGDLGNIKADAQGHARKQWRLRDATLQPGQHSVVGRSVIIHAGEDDLKTDPAGNSGARIAGGVIEAK